MKHKKQERQERISRDKERARLWADNRRLRRAPLIVAQEVTNAYSLAPSSNHQAVQVLEDLERRRDELLQEAEQIQSAIQVIKRTLLK